MLPSLIQNNKKDLLLKLLKVTLDFETTGKDGQEEIEPIVKKYWIKDALMKHTESIAKLCGVEAAQVGIEIIKKINIINAGLRSYLWIPTIEKSSQILFEDDYTYQLVAFIRDVLENCEAIDIVGGMLKDDANILKRIAIHIINKKYNSMKAFFWNYQGNLYEVAEHEVYELLKAHCQELERAEIDKIIAWSEAIKYPSREGKEREMVEAWKRKEMLSAVMGNKDDRIKSIYDKYDKIAPGKLEHPGLPVWHGETGFVYDKSPIEMLRLLEMTNNEIASYLQVFKEEKTWGLEQISEDGLKNEIEKCVTENPQKFTEDMSPFLDVQTKYQYAIVIGFTKAWQAKKDFPVAKVLDFIEQLVVSEKLWVKKGEDKKDFYENEIWIISRIADFIEEGVRNDDYAFAEENLPQIERLLGELVKKTPSHISDSKRILDSILGSPRANVFSAIILYVLRHARLYKKKEKVRWTEEIKNNFTKWLDPAIEPDPDFILTLMRYLPNLIYLDKQWVVENLSSLFPLKDNERWKKAFEGYLTYSMHVYQEFYTALKEGGHYSKAINTDFERHSSDKLVQQIAIGFIEKWEEVTDSKSLISELLKKRNASQLSDLVSFLGQIREGKPLEKLRGRIKQLWGVLYSLLVEEQGKKEYQQVAARFYSWLGVIEEIDEEVNIWMKLTAKYIHIHWYEYNLVEELVKHVEKTPKYVGEIYIEMLSSGAYAYPDYKKEETIKIVETLYMNGQKEYADTICNMYGEKEAYFLTDTYKKYNGRSSSGYSSATAD
jgi:hypothetical protein